MASLNKKLFYAVEAVLHIAYNSSQGAIASRDIAERQGLPPRYLENLMQRLVRGGVLRGIRGPNGGYVLAKERRRITVSDICNILSDEDDDEKATGGTKLGVQVVAPLWGRAQAQMLEALAKVSLADLCDEAQTKNIKRTADEKLDFAI